MSDQSLGDKLGNAADAVKHKVNEAADRARAEGHDAKSQTSDNPIESLVEKGKAALDRGKAEAHEHQADRDARDAGR
ncbi:hypothetical protein [Deinococcus peraridilitoris]|uniref:Uncharacterized protein n=1 Tax=Deinococcus peraridilitoris (strain DSM 19664 / LMG 22246 / CIP 109416 / KR-200) TaxID=937777 RepID=L0A5X0_DEIPD|nr:hypothetical protein [Deinococcus peraridilitoris]AFZ68562.1 hypothetical protein Deipe_3116 [Deinococcus peraridilitoris DSM 19664]